MVVRVVRVALSALLVASVMMVMLASPRAQASSSPPSSSLGFDISFPQCNNANLPTSAGFGIVGVNDGHPFSTNPCLVSEIQWSQASLTGQANFYANTDDPGPAYNASWPLSQQAPQLCHGANSAPCAYDYGWNGARASFANAVAGEAAAGSSDPTIAATNARWWLDVESGNAWQALSSTYGRSALTLGNDQNAVLGARAYFASVGVSSVGIYSTGYQWNEIMGSTGSVFASSQAWMPGYATLAQAQAACLSPSFLGGRVAMIQYPSLGLDGDFACGLISSPTNASVTVAGSSSYLAQLSVLGESSPLTYTQQLGAPSLVVSSTGAVHVPATLAAGNYVASGTLTDALGNSGTFSFVLVVGVITQISATSSSVTVAGSSSFSTPLIVTGANGATVFSTTSSSPGLVVSSTGQLTTTGQLSAGTYSVSGTTTDQGGDHGVFSYSLVVGALAQNDPLFASVSANAAPNFTDQLTITGASGALTFTQTSGAPNLLVSSTGLVTTSGALPPGSYVVRGTTSDTSGDQGKFFFNLQVTAAVITPIVQSPPLTTSIPSANTPTFSVQLVVSGALGAVTFTQTSGAPALVVSTSGLVSTSGALSSGTYVVSGTTSDASGDEGVFSYTLDVGSLTQNAPLFASMLSAATSSYSTQLSVTGASGPVTFIQSRGAPALVVSTTGLLTTSGVLATGSYVVRGTTSDPSGDTGTFFFNVRVTSPVVTPIVQSPPLVASILSATSSSFSTQLSVTGASGTVTFRQVTGAPALLVTSTGLVTTSGVLAPGSYVVRGTTSDSSGETGTFFFNVRVTAAVVTPLVQSTPVVATILTSASSTYSHQLLVSDASGAVSFVQSKGAPALVVSTTGLLTTSGVLAPGSYVVRGTTSDPSGDTGTFFFHLLVSATAPPTTTTTTPTTTTTTTVPKITLPVAFLVVGHAVAGKTVTLSVHGLGFYGRPTVTSHPGTRAVVTKDTGTVLTLTVSVRPHSRNGLFTFTITLANHKRCRVRYVQRLG